MVIEVRTVVDWFSHLPLHPLLTNHDFPLSTLFDPYFRSAL